VAAVSGHGGRRGRGFAEAALMGGSGWRGGGELCGRARHPHGAYPGRGGGYEMGGRPHTACHAAWWGHGRGRGVAWWTTTLLS
jgi:hypothetical protein